MDERIAPGIGLGHSQLSFGGRCAATAAATGTPFGFPFGPLSLSLFDTDPSRIVSILHHQALLAEEAFRYRSLLFPQKDAVRVNPLAELLSKEHDQVSRRSALFKTAHRLPITPPELFMTPQKDFGIDDLLRRNIFINETPKHDVYRSVIDEQTTMLMPKRMSLDGVGGIGEKCSAASTMRDAGEEFLRKRSGAMFREGLRYNPIASNSDSLKKNDLKEKSPNLSSSSSSPVGGIYPVSESMLLQDNGQTIEEETNCTVCRANFPSVWLLEQHAALQHAGTGMDEKPFICEQCGQSYRYRSAYVKHREQNHRARLPADKLFTCDVCGMQFRYLKSFKKHRLNHALERLHGKNEKFRNSASTSTAESSSELVSSSNESIVAPDDVVEVKVTIKEELQEDDVDDQDDTIDSVSVSERATMRSLGSTLVSHSNQTHAVMSKRFEPESTTSTAATVAAVTSINSLINSETVPNEQALGLNAQEASILNFLRVDAAERQRDRRFACPFCGKCVRSKENLKLHVRKHTGERPFVCLFCGRAFGGKSDLTRHLRIHTGERPYHCEACGKCFARADYLSKHLTTHIHNAPR